MVTIRFSPLAQDDLIEIKSYIADKLASPLAAKNTMKRITKRIRDLEISPEIGTPLSAVCAIESDYRILVCNSYLVFYRYENKTVSVIRVLYGRSNYLATLFGDQLGDDFKSLYGKE